MTPAADGFAAVTLRVLVRHPIGRQGEQAVRQRSEFASKDLNRAGDQAERIGKILDWIEPDGGGRIRTCEG